MSIYLNKQVIADLSWFTDTIGLVSGVCLLNFIIWSTSDANLTIYCNASMTALGFYILQMNLAITSPISQEQGLHHIFFYKAFCIVLALAFATQLNHPPACLLIFTDSLNTVNMFHLLKAAEDYNHLLLFTAHLLLLQKTTLHVFHITGMDKITDAVMWPISYHNPPSP